MQNEFEKRLARINERNDVIAPQAKGDTMPPPLPVNAHTPRSVAIVRKVLIGAMAVVCTGAVFIGISSFSAGQTDSAEAPSEYALSNLISISDIIPLDGKMIKDARMSYILFRYENGKITREEAIEKLEKAGIDGL